MKDTLTRTILVFLGGGVGATLRYLIGLWIPASWAAPLPLAILLINMAGAAGLGMVFVLADEAHLLSPLVRLTVAVGVLGGFTTWSTYMTGAVLLARAGQMASVALYLLVSLAGGPLAVAAAGTVTRRMLILDSRRLVREPLSVDLDAIEAEDRQQST